MKHRISNKTLFIFVLAIVAVSFGVLLSRIQQNTSVSTDDARDQRREILSVQSDDYVYGSSDAEVILFEYADTECPFCKRLYFKTQNIIAEYAKKGISVAVVYRHAPLGRWDKSITEAHAAECVGAQKGPDGYHAFLSRLYETTPSDNGFDVALLPSLAQSAGADTTAFTLCMDSLEYLDKIKKQKLSSAALGVSTIPHLFIVGKSQIYEVVGNKPKDTITFLIEQALQDK